MINGGTGILDTRGLLQQELLKQQQGREQQPQKRSFNEIIESPAFSNAMLSLSSAIAQSQQQGLGIGGALANGGLAFNNEFKQHDDRVKAAERRSTQDRIAAIKDLHGANTDERNSNLRERQFGLSERNFGLREQQFQTEARRAEADALEQQQRKQAVEGIVGQNPEFQELYALGGAAPILDVIKQRYAPPAKGTKIQGLEIAPGANPTADDAKKVKSVLESKSQLDKLVKDYSGLVKKYGSETVGTQGEKLISQKKSQIDLQAKNLEDLGALQEADRAILGDMLGNPVYNVSDVGSYIRRATGTAKETALLQISDYEKYLKDRVGATLSTRGYVQKQEAKAPDFDQSLLEFMTPEQKALFSQ